MKILITGSAGFIGSHLTAYLLKKDMEVVGLDDFSTGSRQNVERNKNIFGEKYTFHEGSVLDMKFLKSIFNEIDAVFHLAAQVSVIKSLENPLETHNINTSSFLEILELAKEKKLKKFVYPSSCSVYSSSINNILDEGSKIDPLSIYASTKYLNDLYAKNLSSINGYPKVIGLRLFNVFGSWQDNKSGYASVIPIWISRIINNLQPIIYGDGKSTRDFVHVNDVCNAFYLALQNNHDLGSIYNIGYGNSVNLLELLEVINSVLLDDFQIINRIKIPIFKNSRIGEVKYSKSNISRARTELGFEPIINLRNGIIEILENQYKLKKKSINV